MKQRLIILFIVSSWSMVAQENVSSYIDFNNYKGIIGLHKPDILHLIQEHPTGVVLSWNKKTFGEEEWQQRYNYPDHGSSFIYQDFKNPVLGKSYTLLTHYNFYFFNRNILFRIGQGLTYNTKPYDRVKNPKNIAFGSHFLTATSLLFNYKKERLFNRFGVQAGVKLLHNSNANVKAPNTGINTVSFNLGVIYSLNDADPEYISTLTKERYTESIKFNLMFRSGVNQSDLVGSARFPFYVFSAYADKRLSWKSAIQLGTDVFFSNFLKEYIKYRSIAFAAEADLADSDYKRVGVFIGHELFVNKLSFISQFGYYVYYPYDFEGRTYIRVGLKRYFKKKWFASLTLKSHAVKAEAAELGFGIRL